MQINVLSSTHIKFVDPDESVSFELSYRGTLTMVPMDAQRTFVSDILRAFFHTCGGHLSPDAQRHLITAHDAGVRDNLLEAKNALARVFEITHAQHSVQPSFDSDLQRLLTRSVGDFGSWYLADLSLPEYNQLVVSPWAMEEPRRAVSTNQTESSREQHEANDNQNPVRPVRSSSRATSRVGRRPNSFNPNGQQLFSYSPNPDGSIRRGRR